MQLGYDGPSSSWHYLCYKEPQEGTARLLEAAAAKGLFACTLGVTSGHCVPSSKASERGGVEKAKPRVMWIFGRGDENEGNAAAVAAIPALSSLTGPLPSPPFRRGCKMLRKE